MALVKELKASDGKTIRMQSTQVVCYYRTDDLGSGRKIMQLDTMGSETREFAGKVSQTLQFDERAARALWEIVGREFGFQP